MEELYLYLFKAILSLGMVYAVYAFFLRKLTFFQWNRWYLLLYSLMAFMVPLININEIETVQQNLAPISFISEVPSITQWVLPEITPLKQPISDQQTASNQGNQFWIIAGMMFISIVLLMRLVISIISLFNITRNAEILGYMNQCKIVRVPKPLSPFSFSNTIVIGNQAYAPDELENILAHEIIHTRQRHSIDMVFAEILIVLAWWNPFSWLVRKSIRQNLEFIADREVLKQGVEVHPYQMLLLKTMQNPALRITNAFSFSHIKKRIMMMNIKPSHRLQLARFILIAPVFAVLILLFRSPITNAQETASSLKTNNPDFENSEIFAEIKGDGEESITQSSTAYFGGVVIHEETGKPLAKFPISITLNDKTLTTLFTDQSGKYFYATPIPQTGTLSLFSWKLIHTEFAPSEAGFSIKDSVNQPEFYVHLVAPKKTKKRSVSEPVQVSLNQIVEWNYNSIAILNSIVEKSGAIFNNHRELLAMEKDFLNKVDTTNKTFVLYNGWLYWKRMENESWSRLEKPENLILKLAEDTVNYEQINNWFADHKRYMVVRTPAYKNKGSLLCLEFHTEPFNLPKPSATLLKNGAYIPTSYNTFNDELTKKDAVFLNGYRAYRNGEFLNYNTSATKDNVKKIYKLTGNLATYYSENASVVWWIETKEADKVINRPEFDSIAKQENLVLFQNGTIMPCNYGIPERLTVNTELMPITVVFNQPEPIHSLTLGKVVSVIEINKTQLIIIKHSNGNYITYGNLQNIRIKKGDVVDNATVLGLPQVNDKGELSITLQYDTPEGTIGCRNCVEALKELAVNDRQITKAQVLSK